MKVDINLVNYACIVDVSEMKHRVHIGNAVQNSRTFQVSIKDPPTVFKDTTQVTRPIKVDVNLVQSYEKLTNLSRIFKGILQQFSRTQQ